MNISFISFYKPQGISFRLNLINCDGDTYIVSANDGGNKDVDNEWM